MARKTSAFLYVLVIVLLSLTAAMTLLGGIGTTCVAFNAEDYGPRMAALIPVKPVFQLLVFVSIGAGLFGIYSIVLLTKRRADAYRLTLVFLILGLVSSAIQFYYSLTLRGSTAPNNIRLYLTAITLLVFLLSRLPGIWERTGFTETQGGNPQRPAGGLALVVTGLATMSATLWAAPTHIIDQVNTANVLFWPLVIVGALLIMAGSMRVFGFRLRRSKKSTSSLTHIIKGYS